TAVTLLAFTVGLAAAGAIVLGQRPLALALWLANRILDGLDGAMARAQGRASDLGAYLDILLDFVVYAAIPLALAAAADEPRTTAALLVLMASFFVNAASWMYLAALLERRGEHTGITRVVMPPGLVAGTETILFFSAAILLPRFVAPIAWSMAALVAVGVLQRVRWAVRGL
ncbi:MAG: CDP-alcohol phosphatidyltransferase family protein, partial [Gemmatimonadota bacterium]|nr:CDP-alcohol phosphatidyltransferase family protein [Gemmatimonadota bacterium]